MVVNRMIGPAGPRPVADVAPMTPKEIWAILRRHILLMVALTIVGLIVGGVAWYLLRQYYPKYIASTYVEVLPPVETDPMTIVSPQVHKDIRYGYRLSIANLIRQQSTFMDLVGRDRVKETNWFRRRDRSIVKAIKYLQKYFGAYAHRDSDLIEISMTCRSKEEAALIVNEMLELFLGSYGETKKREISERLAGLEEQRNRVQAELNAAEDALATVRTATGLTDLETYPTRFWRHTITIRLQDLEIEENDLTLAIKQIQADIKNLERLAAGPINEQIENQIENDLVMISLANQLAFQKSALKGRLSKFGENHRVVREMQELINEIREERRARKAEIAEQTRQANLKNAQDTLLVFQSRLEELEKRRQEATAEKRNLDLARIQYERRMRIRDERVEMLNGIKEQIEKLRIVREDPETPKVRSVGRARVPLEMVTSRKWWVYFPTGTVLGFLLSIGLAFLIEMLNDLVRTPRDVARFLHIPLLGVVPDAAEDGQLRGIDLYHVVRQAPYSIVSESYRRFRANLKLSSAAEAAKALLVSSGMAGDGKTSVAVNLATTFVAENKKVLLIDANFWRPSLHAIFPRTQDEFAEQSEFGLSSLLMGQCSAQQIIKPTGINGFNVIDSGPLPANPAELLSSAMMEQLIKQQRETYDYVIVDGPPVLLIGETKVLARMVDGTVLVFNAAATRRGAAARTIRELNEVNAKILGCVLFGVRAMKGGYFQEQFKSYQRYQKAAAVV